MRRVLSLLCVLTAGCYLNHQIGDSPGASSSTPGDGMMVDFANAPDLATATPPNQLPGVPDSNHSKITAQPTMLPADGLSTSALTVLIADSNGNPVAGQSVTLSSDGGDLDKIVPKNGITDATGTFTAAFSSTRAGVKIVRAALTSFTLQTTVQFTAAACNGTLLFSELPWPASAPQAEVVSTGDFNGDGKIDLATNAHVLLNNGDGTFSPVSYPTGTNFTAEQPGDFNGDGKLDLAGNSGNVFTSNSFPSSITVLLGNGDGTFQPPVQYPTGTNEARYSRLVKSGDFNGDGKLDLIQPAVDAAFLLLGNGDGTFQPAIAVSYGITMNGSDGEEAITLGDFNGDGKLDFVSTAADASLNVGLGNGDGTFQPVVSSSLGWEGVEVKSADLNRDGRLDLLLADDDDGTLHVMLGNGDGTFTDSVDYSNIDTTSIAVADLDGDGKLDLVSVIGTYPDMTVSMGNGDGTFQPPTTYSAGFTASYVVLADLNGDGKLDIATANWTGSETSVYLGNGDGTFAAPLAYPVGDSTIPVIAADFNGDGKLDLAGSQSVLLGNGDGTFQAGIAFTTPNPIRMLLSGDFNADGKMDVATLDDATGSTVTVLLGNGDGTLAQAETYPVNPNAAWLMVGDFNGDGKLDLVTASAYTTASGSGMLSALLGNGDGTFQVAVMSSPITWSQEGAAAGDFNGDGKLDIVRSRGDGCSSCTDHAGVSLGNGDGTFQAPLFSGNGGIYGEHPLTVADFNADGRLDVVTAAGSSGGSEVTMYLGNGDGTFQPAMTVSPLLDPGALTTGDFNNDGKLDLAFTSNRAEAVTLLMGNGDGTFGAPVSYPAGGSPTGVTTADFDGDGTLDFAIVSNPEVGILLNSGCVP